MSRLAFSPLAPARLLLALLLVAGCRSTAPPEPEDNLASLPSLDEIAPATPRPEPPAHLQPHTQVRIRTYFLPADFSPSRLRAVMNRAALDDTATRRWRWNGLEAGVLGRKEVRRFLEMLPANVRSRSVSMMVGSDPAAVLTTGPLNPERRITWTLAGEHGQETRRSRGGRFRFLLEAGRGRPPRLTLTPQHHKPRLTLEPREPGAKVLDGEIFTPLALSAALPPDRFLMIAPATRAGPGKQNTDTENEKRPRDAGEAEEEKQGAGEAGGEAAENRTIDLGTLMLGRRPDSTAPYRVLLLQTRPLAPPGW